MSEQSDSESGPLLPLPVAVVPMTKLEKAKNLVRIVYDRKQHDRILLVLDQGDTISEAFVEALVERGGDGKTDDEEMEIRDVCDLFAPGNFHCACNAASSHIINIYIYAYVCQPHSPHWKSSICCRCSHLYLVCLQFYQI
jgi:hypothetical protein